MNLKLEMISDEELAQQAANGDRDAFDAIVCRYSRPLGQFILSRTAVMQDAEDIVQETFLRFYESIQSFDGRYSLKNWLYTIAYRISVSAYRRKRPVLLSQEMLQQQVDTAAQSEAAGEGLWNVVRDMKPDDHTVLWLRYKQDMEIDEIAKIMKKTKTGVRVHLHRARTRLADKIRAAEACSSAPTGNPAHAVFAERVK
jgi:RNA polymerase sigma-70 factor (ECF subfamily)